MDFEVFAQVSRCSTMMSRKIDGWNSGPAWVSIRARVGCESQQPRTIGIHDVGFPSFDLYAARAAALFVLVSNRKRANLLLESHTTMAEKTDVWQGTLALMVLKTLAALGAQ